MRISNFKEYTDTLIDNLNRATWTVYVDRSTKDVREGKCKHLLDRPFFISSTLIFPVICSAPPQHTHIHTHTHTHKVLLQVWLKYSERKSHMIKIKINKYGITNKLQFLRVYCYLPCLFYFTNTILSNKNMYQTLF